MRRLLAHVMSVLPLVVIAGLLYAGFFVKLQVVGSSVKPPPIEHRDRFYGIALPAP